MVRLIEEVGPLISFTFLFRYYTVKSYVVGWFNSLSSDKLSFSNEEEKKIANEVVEKEYLYRNI